MARAGSNADKAVKVVDTGHRRFPWPGDAEQRRYGPQWPYLAIVNARGPWAVWRHASANPPFIPLCLDLAGKDFWCNASDRQRCFCLRMWMRAAAEDRCGVIWGDPVRLQMDWGMDGLAFAENLDWFIASGLGCYLSPAEKAAVESWRPQRNAAKKAAKTGGGREKPEGGLGGSLEKGKGGKQSKASKAREDKVKQDKAEPAPLPDSSARANIQTSEFRLEEQARQARQASKQVTGKPQQRSQGTAQGQEPGNLPESDHGAATERAKATANARGLPECDGRPRSVSSLNRKSNIGNRKSDAVRLGDPLAWQDGRALAFAGAMFEAIKERRPPISLQGATDEEKADLGVWVHYWHNEVRTSLDMGRYDAFEARCVKDVSKKRRARGIRNLGAVARKKIVPGVLASMSKETKSE